MGRKLKVFEGSVRRGAFVPNKDEIIGGRRISHSEELYNF
jgi:hypothetical protein